MKDIAKQIILLEKKIEHASNDVVKTIIIDAIQHSNEVISGTEFARSTYAEYYNSLITGYKDMLKELRSQNKNKTKQIEISDEQNEGI